MPIGSYIGNLNWRLTFAIVGIFGLLTIIGVRYNIPALDADSRGDIKKDFSIFKKPELLMVIAIRRWVPVVSLPGTVILHRRLR